ncbi:MAG: DinB family protein [Bryobacteraceae bacterium]
MNKNTIPGMSQLESTAEILRLLMEGLSEEDAQWKPAPDRWSIAEILEHLSHVEGHCFRSRVERIMTEDLPVLETYDQNALSALGQYSGREPDESFAHFEEQREDNLDFLLGLETADLLRRGRHPGLGDITIGHLLHEWAFHDLGHIRQIAELIRARTLYPGMGPIQQEYEIHP